MYPIVRIQVLQLVSDVRIASREPTGGLSSVRDLMLSACRRSTASFLWAGVRLLVVAG